MSSFPEPVPNNPGESPGDPAQAAASDPLTPGNMHASTGEGTNEPQVPAPLSGSTNSFPFATAVQPVDQILFPPTSLPHPPPAPEERIPHLGHLGLLGLLVLFGLAGAWMLSMGALQIHLWGISKTSDAATDFHYSMLTQVAWYFITFAGCLFVFPLVWRKPFFQGVHWEIGIAIQRFRRLVSAAIVCFFVAMINGVLMPGPENAPIDQIFKAPGAAWVLFAFGVTLAPFFEEMAFRGFILPSLCTAWDWSVEHLVGAPRRPLDKDGNPNWSLTAMLVGSVATSIPFALMHGAQTAWSLGPFLLLVFVSLVLCWVRLSTRSLATSTIVHASYNFMLFSFMLLGTGGFKHLDKM